MFSPEQSAFLSGLYFSHGLRSLTHTYYKLWRYLLVSRDPGVLEIMQRLDAVILERFGPGFVVVADFFSYRDFKSSQARRCFSGRPADSLGCKHQDGQFWLTTGDSHLL